MAMAMVARLHVYDVHQMLPLSSVPVQLPVQGAAGHNRWGVAETPLPVKTQGRTMGPQFNHVVVILEPLALWTSPRQAGLHPRLWRVTRDVLATSNMSEGIETRGPAQLITVSAHMGKLSGTPQVIF